mgnify:CR=1 FL=1
MAGYSREVGYQYDTNARKLMPEYEPKKNPYSQKKTTAIKNNANVQNKANAKQKPKAILYILLGFSILFAISYRYSIITERFNEKEDLKKQLSALQKENAQTEISIQNSLNLTNMQKAASSVLGMKKLDDSQKVYVSLPKKDYVEPASEQIVVEDNEKNWLQEIINMILGN